MYWYKIVITKPTVTYVIRNLFYMYQLAFLHVPVQTLILVGGLKRCSILKDSEVGPILALSEQSPFTVDLY